MAQMFSHLYTNDITLLLITIVLFCLNVAAAGMSLRLLFRKISLLKWIAFTLFWTISGYIISSALLFSFNWFSIRKALLFSLFLLGCVSAGIFLWHKKHGLQLWGSLDADLRPHLIPICLVLIGLFISWGNFGYYGMGQDPGVYQVHAINLINGETDRVYHFDEYSKIESPEKKETYYVQVRDQLLGLEMIDNTLEENRVLAGLRTGGNDSHEHTDGIFHGIPTWPALLALWGSMASLSSMTGIQTLLYLLSILMLWFTAENLGLKKWAAALICTLFMLSPENVWVSKSTITEELLALIISGFLYLLTNPAQPGHRWYSAFMVFMFALVHVSVFAVVPMFFILYLCLYLWNGDRQYLRGLFLSALGFITGFTFMVLVSPRYTIRNTALIWIGPIRLDNVYWVLAAVSLAAMLISLLFRRVNVKGRFRSFLQGTGGSWCIRVLLLLLLAFSVINTVRKSVGSGFENALVTNGLYNMCWMTGLIFLPVVIFSLLRKPEKLFENEISAGLTFLFGYAVILMCTFMKADIQYCYYFGRYLTPYIPVACLMIGVIWNRYSGKTLCTGIVIGSLISVPFDMTMICRQDDTFCTYETFSRVIDSLRDKNAAVIFEDYPKLFMLPVKTITGTDCYFAEENLELQAQKLSFSYSNVYCVTCNELDWKPITKISETAFIDDNSSFRMPLCPFPLSFNHIPYQYNVYKYKDLTAFPASVLTSPVSPENGVLVLPPGYVQQGPYISVPAGNYELHYYGKNLSNAICYPSTNDGVMLENSITLQTDEEVVITFSADYDLSGVEFITRNFEDYPITIELITLETRSDNK